MLSKIRRSFPNELITYSLCHGLVDFTCAFAVCGISMFHPGWNIYVGALLLVYNFCAFALQPFIGAFADYLNRTRYLAAAGCIFVAVGILLSRFALPAVIIIGIGNAMFHVGGGASVIRTAKHRATALGIFISVGAIGLSTGISLQYGYLYRYFRVVNYSRTFLTPVCIAVMVIAAAAILFFDYSSKDDIRDTASAKVPRGALFPLMLIFLLASVFTRSFVGYAVNTQWEFTAAIIVVAGATALGKAFGGVLGDKIGYIPVTLVGLVASAVLLPFFNRRFIPYFIGLMLFNFTMPLVLAALTDIFPGHTAFAFGLNSAFLLPGILFAGVELQPFQIMIMIILCAVILTVCFRIIYAERVKGVLRNVKARFPRHGFKPD